MFYSIELVTSDKEYYWDDGLNRREIMESIALYLEFGGRIRVWHGMKLICEYSK